MIKIQVINEKTGAVFFYRLGEESRLPDYAHCFKMVLLEEGFPYIKDIIIESNTGDETRASERWD